MSRHPLNQAMDHYGLAWVVHERSGKMDWYGLLFNLNVVGLSIGGLFFAFRWLAPERFGGWKPAQVVDEPVAWWQMAGGLLLGAILAVIAVNCLGSFLVNTANAVNALSGGDRGDRRASLPGKPAGKRMKED